MDKILDDFLNHILSTRSGSKATYDAYKRDIARLITYLNKKNISSLYRTSKNEM